MRELHTTQFGVLAVKSQKNREVIPKMTISEFRDILNVNNAHMIIDDPFAFTLKYGGIEVMYQLYQSNSDIQLAIARQYLYTQRMYYHCNTLFDDLDHINYAIIKGAVLSQRIYSNPAIRKSSDIDILISRNQLDYVKSVLEKHGFQQSKVRNGKLVPYTRRELVYHSVFTHQTASFRKLTSDPLCPIINVDINTDIFWGESSHKADMIDFLRHTEKTEIFGIKAKRLTTIYDFISLCLHHYKDLNSLYLLWQRGISLSKFCDIYYYLSNIQIEPQQLRYICNQLNVAEYVYYCIYQTTVIFDSNFTVYLNALYSRQAESLLKRIGLSKNHYKYMHKCIASYIFDDNFHSDLEQMLTKDDLLQIKANESFF